MFKKRAAVFYRVVFKPDRTRAASFLNGFKNIPQNAYPSGVRTKVQIVRGRYQHTRKTSGAYKQYGNFKSRFFSFSAYSLLSVVKGGWLNMLRKRKFRELKNQHYTSQIKKVTAYEPEGPSGPSGWRLSPVSVALSD